MNRYKVEMKEFNRVNVNDNVKKPVMPSEKKLLIYANNTSRGILKQLCENEGCGLIFETEFDNMAQALKIEYGNYTDGLRKGFHHEMISYYQHTIREFREIQSPRLSVGLSGTIQELTELIPCTENNLFSRFMFYFMNSKPEWKDVFPAQRDQAMEDDFDELGQEFLAFYTELNKHPDMCFHFTADQINQFNYFFTLLQNRYLVLQDKGFIATIRRLGLITFRMSMIFSALRILETIDFSQRKECLDVDFKASLSIVRVLVRHASYVYSLLPYEERPVWKTRGKKDLFLNGLPENFTRTSYLELAEILNITKKTADRYIAKFCEEGLTERIFQGIYINLVYRGRRK